VLAGQKRLTLASIPKFARGLGLPRELADFFHVLAQLEHEDCRAGRPPEKIRAELERLRARIGASHGLSFISSDEAFRISSIPEVYAALGSVEKGASLADISRRVSFPTSEIQAALAHMQRVGLVTKKELRFYPVKAHFSFEGLNLSEVFTKHFVSSCERLAKTASTEMKSKEKLFHSSAFSVHERDLPRMKEELRSLILRFVDSSEQSEGDRVVNLVTSLF
jgi:uncharacterized protein (TIGR02147 family)